MQKDRELRRVPRACQSTGPAGEAEWTLQEPESIEAEFVRQASLAGLGVLPCERVNVVGGGLAVQGGVGSVVVVVVEPGLVGGLALGLAGVGVGVGPLEGQSAVEALDLAVGLGPVGAGVAVLDAGCGQDLVKGP